MSERDLPAIVGTAGVLVGLAGFAGFVVPGVSASFAFVALVGVIAGVQGVRYALGRREVTTVETETGDPERRHRVPAPGDDAWRKATRTGGRIRRGHLGRRGRSARHGSGRDGRRSANVTRWRRRPPRTMRRRVRDAVVETIRLREHCSIEDAERLIETGAWTDDPVAAGYLGADVALSLETRVRLLLARNAYQARTRRAVDALEALMAHEGSIVADGVRSGDDSGRPDERIREGSE
ncbi:DUF7269 family protein [Halobellus captivus]|uniref:DUF7269 family protein n=1 Tax=Halobellus captivus TaxID=2592614 RepID=UPI00193A90EF|nr:hypothetical protein [Halobellus captivus]